MGGSVSPVGDGGFKKLRPSSVEAFFFFVLWILVCPDGAYPLWVKPFFLLGRDFVCLVLLVAACPAGATAQPLAAGCLLAAMPLRDSSCPVGAVPLYGWGR